MDSDPPGSSGERPEKRKRDSTPSKETTDKKPRTENVVDKSLSNFQDNLLSVLLCPLCLDFMKGPILQCSTGHSFCSNCIKQVTYCPVCITPIGNPVRNFSLEQLSEKLTDPCPNQKHGCQERVYGEKDPHEKLCLFQECPCFFPQLFNTECCWTGLRQHMREHVQETHQSHAPPGYYDLESSRIRSFAYEFENECVNDVEIFYHKDDLFLVYVHYEKRQSKCWMAVQYLGPSENATNFAYTIMFASPEKSREITYYRKVHRQDEDIQTLFDTDDCFNISEKEVQFFKVPDEEPLLYNEWTVVRV